MNIPCIRLSIDMKTVDYKKTITHKHFANLMLISNLTARLSRVINDLGVTFDSIDGEDMAIFIGTVNMPHYAEMASLFGSFACYMNESFFSEDAVEVFYGVENMESPFTDRTFVLPYNINNLRVCSSITMVEDDTDDSYRRHSVIEFLSRFYAGRSSFYYSTTSHPDTFTHFIRVDMTDEEYTILRSDAMVRKLSDHKVVDVSAFRYNIMNGIPLTEIHEEV